MRTLLYLLLGYSIFEIEVSRIKDVLNLLSQKNIPIISFYSEGEKVRLKIKYKSKNNVLLLLNDAKVVKSGGLPLIIDRYKHRFGLISGILIMFLAIYVSPLFVWNIEIKGIDRLSREYVSEILAEAGVKLGTFSPNIVRSDVYEHILTSGEDISWISVNFIGSTANVEIIERDYTSASKCRSDGANIIAAEDGLIIDIDILKGRRVASNNEVVKKGDLLVSGVYDSIRMGTRYVYSDAKVLASIFKEFSVEIPLETLKKQYTDETTTEVRLKLFGKSINIFKNYSKTSDKYDIIIRDRSVPVFGFEKLPIVLETTVALNYENLPVTLSQNQAIDKARSKIKELITAENFEEILSTEYYYDVDGDVLKYSCQVNAVKNIAKISEFDID